MKKQGKTVALLLMSTFLFSCKVSIPSPYSYDYPSYSSPYFDFDPNENGKRKLLEINLDRQFSVTADKSFEDELLDANFFSEDKEAKPFYRSEEEQEAVDLSEEIIEFSHYNNALEQFAINQNEGPLNTNKVNELFSILDSNDDVINNQEATYQETDYSKDYLNGPYYAFNNYHKEEQSILTRYTNEIVQGATIATIYYQDGFKYDYTMIDQMWSDGFKIYEIHEEKFPVGSTNANSYKITSNRTTGNFKQALQVSGGARAKRYIEKTMQQYDGFNQEVAVQDQKYTYQIRATKTNEKIKFVFQGNIQYHLDEKDQAVYDTEIIYEVIIEQGIVSQHHISQKSWAPSKQDQEKVTQNVRTKKHL